MAVIRIGEDSYVQWDPDFPAGEVPDGAAADSAKTDMRAGLGSDPFRARAADIRDRVCKMLREAFDENMRQAQQALTERWTVHPFVDGCTETPPPPAPIP